MIKIMICGWLPLSLKSIRLNCYISIFHDINYENWELTIFDAVGGSRCCVEVEEPKGFESVSVNVVVALIFDWFNFLVFISSGLKPCLKKHGWSIFLFFFLIIHTHIQGLAVGIEPIPSFPFELSRGDVWSILNSVISSLFFLGHYYSHTRVGKRDWVEIELPPFYISLELFNYFFFL